MLENSGKSRFEYGTFYDSPLLLTLLLPTSVRRQGTAENPVSILKLSVGTLWTKIYVLLGSSFSIEQNNNQSPWPESGSELYRPSDSRLSAKLVQTFADRGCHVVSVTYPYAVFSVF
jgi:hypothetical protein